MKYLSTAKNVFFAPHAGVVSVISFVLAALFLASSGASAAALEYVRIEPVTTEITAPTAAALDSEENLYVVESSTGRLLKHDGTGRYVSSIRGLGRPVSISIDAGGRIFVGNSENKSVDVYDTDLNFLHKLGSGNAEISMPGGIATDYLGNAYVADSKADCVKIYNPDGSFRTAFGSSGSGAGQFHFPIAIVINRAESEIYVADLQLIQTKNGRSEGARVQVFTHDGKYKRSFGDYGQGDGKLTRPAGLAIDTAGRIFVTDSYQNVVQVFDSGGSSLGALYNLERPMRTPMGITVSSSGTVYVASLNTGKVEVFSVK